MSESESKKDQREKDATDERRADNQNALERSSSFQSQETSKLHDKSRPTVIRNCKSKEIKVGDQHDDS
jgi:hypothetical protein